MAKAVPTTTRPVATAAGVYRPRTSSILAGMAFLFLAIVGAVGVDWAEGPAMVLGEVAGIVAPVVLIGLAGLIIYRICQRASDQG
ncbi:MAG TPA: hypothetical protein VMU59_01025 [Caulobacteraceae bacterium]|nr:hypothetical protein [Caulobacteraceae bacterium]